MKITDEHVMMVRKWSVEQSTKIIEVAVSNKISLGKSSDVDAVALAEKLYQYVMQEQK